MNRREAIDKLAQHQVGHLTLDERVELLLDWCTIDSDDPSYEDLPHQLRAILPQDEVNDGANRLYDPLLHLAIQRSFIGVLNEYLEYCLSQLGYNERVDGEIESLVECLCCAYQTLEERGWYEICPVCYWEDDGTSNPDTLSSPNRMTLAEARRSFSNIGAVSDLYLHHVLRDGKARYIRASKHLEAPDATILTINVTTSPPLRSPKLDDAATVVRKLLNNGYDEIDLVGLEPFGAKLRDGQIWDSKPLRVDDDAEFLVEGYHALARCIASRKHWVYLADGCFEITAHIRGDDVKMRIGEYRTPFEFDSQDGVMISLREYMALWDSIALALLVGSRGST